MSDVRVWLGAGALVTPVSVTRFSSLNEFVALNHLGEGCMGLVRKVMHRSSGEVYALKAVEKKRLLDQKLQDQLVSEVKTQMTLSHPNLLRCFDCFWEADMVYLVLELAAGGDLHQLMKRQGPLVQPDAAYVFMQVCGAAQHLHSKGIIHRDLKPENVLLAEGLQVKIADFGWATQAMQNDTRSTFCGTLCMLAPEIVAGKPYDSKVDVWAIGVLLFEMLMNHSPFDKGNGLMETCKAIVGPGLNAVSLDEAPRAVHPLLRGLMQQKPELRWSLEECLCFPWVVENVAMRSKGVTQLSESELGYAKNTKPPKEGLRPLPLASSRQEVSTSSSYKCSTPSSTAAAASSMVEDISPLSPMVFPSRGSGGSRPRMTAGSSSSGANIKAVEEDASFGERESVSTVASLPEGRWRGKELLPKVDLETPPEHPKLPGGLEETRDGHDSRSVLLDVDSDSDAPGEEAFAALGAGWSPEELDDGPVSPVKLPCVPRSAATSQHLRAKLRDLP